MNEPSGAIHGLYGQLYVSTDGVNFDLLCAEVGDFSITITSDVVEVTNRCTSQDGTTLKFWKQRIYGPNDWSIELEANYLDPDEQLDLLLDAIIEQVPIYFKGVGVVGAGKRSLQGLIILSQDTLNFPKASQSVFRCQGQGATPLVRDVQA